MAVTTYEEVYSSTLAKFRSYEIPEMNDEEFAGYMHDYLVPACANFHVCRKDLTDRDEENQTFNVELTHIEIEILSNYILLEYLDATYIRTPVLLKVDLSSADFNSFNNAVMLGKLQSMHTDLLKENETLLSRYAWQGLRNGENEKVKEELYSSVSGR